MPRFADVPAIPLNLCEISPWIIASEEFNADPRPLHLAGVREANRHFFRKLDAIESAKRRGEVFHEYLDVTFALHQWSVYKGRARSSLRNSYVRFLRGWGIDSNGCEGAVLKSWVQSRFGIMPTFHRKILHVHDHEEDQGFAYDRMKGSQKTNAIFSQLDLLFEFCQYEFTRCLPDEKQVLLFRGTNDPAEHPVVARRHRRESCVRLNNLVSFTSNREKAWEFGSTVWQCCVPLCKVLFYSGLLPDSLLRGEDEYLVIGGHYWVKELLY